jgi:hypothetical protein
MNYQNAKDIFDELKNFEGKATFKGEETKIDYFVLLPRDELAQFDIDKFLDTHQSSGSFEIEGSHEDEPYTLIAVNLAEKSFSNDVDYFMKLLVW